MSDTLLQVCMPGPLKHSIEGLSVCSTHLPEKSEHIRLRSSKSLMLRKACQRSRTDKRASPSSALTKLYQYFCVVLTFVPTPLL